MCVEVLPSSDREVCARDACLARLSVGVRPPRLAIVEFGGGSGANAAGVLDYVATVPLGACVSCAQSYMERKV